MKKNLCLLILAVVLMPVFGQVKTVRNTMKAATQFMMETN